VPLEISRILSWRSRLLFIDRHPLLPISPTILHVPLGQGQKGGDSRHVGGASAGETGGIGMVLEA
jgi:hypothetical protein